MKNFIDLQEELRDLNLPNYRFKQIIRNVCRNFLADPDIFTDIPKEMRKEIGKKIKIFSIKPVRTIKSSNGDTEKTLFKTFDGKKIEAVLMRFKDGRNSICVSCQAGCRMGCRFCATGKLGLQKNLSYEEIFDQVLYFGQILHKEGQKISNIVFMGMGEPFMNYDETLKAADMISDPEYLGIGARKITISTSGIVPGILKFADEPKQYNLAVSLHAPTQDIREKIMPVARRWPLPELMDTINLYIKKTNRRVSYEYIMLNGVNDSPDHAKKLAHLLKGQLCHVNIIPYNPTGTEFTVSPQKKIKEFCAILQKAGINATIRVTMGQDIDAACGQLANKAE
jgi:23S rRNA (adenine2503-C2)-methyltransferase